MDFPARMSSKGQVTVPKPVRELLRLKTGDRVVFRLERNHAILTRTEDFLDLAGAVAVPEGKRGAKWEEIREQARGGKTKDRPDDTP